jgi:hypothetical protein
MIDCSIAGGEMVRRKSIDVQNIRNKILGYTLPYFVILSIWLVFFSPLVSATMYAAPLQLAIPPTTTKTTNSNTFLTYENNSTLVVCTLNQSFYCNT